MLSPTRSLTKAPASRFTTDDERWQALVRHDPRADGVFFVAVKTTGIYCRPVCSSRRPNRENVLFFDDRRSAERAGFRACKRCRPDQAAGSSRTSELVRRACEFIAGSDDHPRLRDIAAAAGVSPFYLQRSFKASLGVTPKQYADAHRAERFQTRLTKAATTTRAAHEAGFASSSTAHDAKANRLGMTPAHFKNGAAGLQLSVATAQSSLGWVLVAATERGICAIQIGDRPEVLRRNVMQRFAKAKIVDGDRRFQSLVKQTVALIETPRRGVQLPLDIQGTAFQQRVWKALQEVPAGQQVTYSELAQRIGSPRAVRAVGSACGANPVAVVIPCHRAIRRDGTLGGYRWGLERKQALLDREAQVDQNGSANRNMRAKRKRAT